MRWLAGLPAFYCKNGTGMNETEAVKLATHYVREQGYDPASYRIRASRQKGSWEVYFEYDPATGRPGPGDFFTVYLDDRSKSVERMVHGK